LEETPMIVRFTFLLASIFFAASALAEKMPPLVSMQLGGEKATVIFDSAKVSSIYTAATFSVEATPAGSSVKQKRGPNLPHAWGIVGGPIAINDTPEHFLEAIKGVSDLIKRIS
jgi:hypothetical protein